jgi:hypothetical protein
MINNVVKGLDCCAAYIDDLIVCSDSFEDHLSKISQQPENCENRNDPDLVQAFLKKWWVESDFNVAGAFLIQGMCM